jgi:hypothetical protein
MIVALAAACIFLWVKPFETIPLNAYMAYRAELDKTTVLTGAHVLPQVFCFRAEAL